MTTTKATQATMAVPRVPRDRHTIEADCQTHQQGFCNLRVSKVGKLIVLDPHVDGSCVITLDRAAAVQLWDLLAEWLR